MIRSLEGKIVLVTGAGRGIGKGIAEYLADFGAEVIIADINEDSAVLVRDSIRKKNLSADSTCLDLSDAQSLKNSIIKIIKDKNKIDVLVNNGGIISKTGQLDLTVEEWDLVQSINLRGAQILSQLVLKGMIERSEGKIVNIASMAGQTGGFWAGAAYTSSKAGLIGLTKSYARFAAPYGVQVNAIAPGLILTEMNKDFAQEGDIPAGRIGTPEDVAKVVYFLSSELSDYITGQTISVNGGMLMP